MASKRTQWKDLSPSVRRGLTVAAMVQVLMLAISHRDISRRPPSLIRGPKGVWRAVTLINFIGPLTYLCFGRRRA